MTVTVTSNGNSVVVDVNSRDTQKSILIHELGHYECARALGYQAQISFDPLNGVFETNYWLDETLPRYRQIEDGATIALGGYEAEELIGVQTAGFLGDLKILFELMRELYGLENKPFPYDVVFQMPPKVYGEYGRRARDILTRVGGKEALEGIAEELMRQIEA